MGGSAGFIMTPNFVKSWLPGKNYVLTVRMVVFGCCLCAHIDQRPFSHLPALWPERRQCPRKASAGCSMRATVGGIPHVALNMSVPSAVELTQQPDVSHKGKVPPIKNGAKSDLSKSEDAGERPKDGSLVRSVPPQ